MVDFRVLSFKIKFAQALRALITHWFTYNWKFVKQNFAQALRTLITHWFTYNWKGDNQKITNAGLGSAKWNRPADWAKNAVDMIHDSHKKNKQKMSWMAFLSIFLMAKHLWCLGIILHLWKVK